MKNDRLFGIVFEKGADCGIAQITVYDDTDNVYINASGDTSVTPVSRLVDLYQPSSGYTAAEKPYCYWIKLEPEHEYAIDVENSGLYNAAASSPYNVNILYYLEREPAIDGGVDTVLVTCHSDFPGAERSFAATPGETGRFVATQTYSGDGVTDTFVLSGSNYAAGLSRVSVDGGANWIYPTDYRITWGSVAPYTDRTAGTDGRLGVVFVIDAPGDGASVVLEFYPVIDTIRVQRTPRQPRSADGEDVNHTAGVSDAGYVLELLR